MSLRWKSPDAKNWRDRLKIEWYGRKKKAQDKPKKEAAAEFTKGTKTNLGVAEKAVSYTHLRAHET